MTEQLDYIFFVYGLSFVLMATQCLYLRMRDRSLSWGLLAAFGAIHGVSQWLDMFAQSLPDTSAFLGVRVLVKVIAFVALFEFGRRGLGRDGRPLAGFWLTAAFIVLAGLGALSGGISGINAVYRYELGFVGSLMAAASIWKVSRTRVGGQCWGFRIASLSLLLFGLATGLVVPKAAFFPANWLNHDTFIAATGFPVQLIRMLSAFAVMTGFWIQGLGFESTKEKIGFIRRWSFPVLFLLLIVLGWFATDLSGKNRDADMRGRLIDQVVRIADTINPIRVETLSFTAADKNNFAFQRLREQLRTYGDYAKCKGIWSIAARERGYVFGPETYDENTAMASEPGEVYKNPPAELALPFADKKAVTFGPYTDEYGTFITAFAPVLEPHTGNVLMVMGLDIMGNDWKAQVEAARRLPIIGALALALILLLGMGTIQWRNTISLESQGSIRHLEVALVAVIGILLTAILSVFSIESNTRDREKIFEEIARMQVEKTSDGFNTIRSDVAALGRFFEGSQRVERDEFQIYAAPMVASGGMQGCAWVQPVSVAQRTEVEAHMQRGGIDNFTIWQNDASGKKISASHREKYYPIIFAEVPGIKSLLGFDEASEPTRRAALEEAVQTGYSTATDSVAVTNDAGGEQALLVFNPVYTKLNRASGERRLSGLAIGMIHYQEFLDRAVGREILSIRLIQTHLVDLMSSDGPRMLAFTGKRDASCSSMIQGESYLEHSGIMTVSPIFAFGRSYAVVSHPTLAFLSAYPARNSQSTIIAGLTITIILSLLVGFIRNRQTFLECEVHQRTEELRESEERLSTTLNSIGDAVISTDANGLVIRMNPVAEQLTGLLLSEAGGRHISDVLRIVNTLTDEPALIPLDEVLSTGEVCHLADHTTLISHDGTRRQIADSAAPILDDTGATTGVVLVFSDVTEQYRNRENLQNEKNNLAAIFASSPVGMLLLDENTMIVDANAVVANMVSRDLVQVIGGRGGGGLGCVHSYEDERGCGFSSVCLDCSLRNGLTQVLSSGTSIHGVEIQTLLLIDGKEEHPWLRVSVEPVTINGRKHIIVAMDDITERKKSEESLRASEATIRNITDSAQDAILMMNSHGLIEFWNPAAERIFGYKADEALGQNLHGFLVPSRYHDAHRQAFPGFQRTGRGNAVGQTLELHAICKNGIEINVSLSLSAIQKNGEWGAVGILRDITAQKQAEAELRQANSEIDNVNRKLEEALSAAHQHVMEVEVAKELIENGAVEMDYQARHDTLTDLPNRLLFSEELDRMIVHHDRTNKQCAVLFLDLDNFKMVNDTMGHKAGDTLLVQTAARLSSCLRENDLLARMGGDEFTVLLKNIRSIEDVAIVAQRMLEQVSTPYEIDGAKLVIGVSIGGSVYPDNATDTIELLKGADAAMYKAKELGRNNYQFFSEEINQESRARAEMESDLRLALERDELKVYYQPIVDIKTMQIAGAEALIRWEHPVKGIMSPGLFLPVAEETGLIVQMGKKVLSAACKQCKNWQDEGHTDFEISVNVSPVQLGEIAIISEVHGALSEAGLRPSCLKLEITETVLAKNDNDEVDILSILRSLGLVICLDDFGIGYSSLSRLNNLPIGHMKIDGYFIRNIAYSHKDRAMTESIIVMAHNLGIKVTAEWIEDEEQMAAIRSLDCDYAQGYLISPAMSAEECGKFIREWTPPLLNANIV